MDPFPRTSTPPARPTRSLPKRFRLGLYTVEGFITFAQIKNHLALLDVAELRAEVEATPEERFPFLPSTPDQRWAWFVGLSVERFERWCRALRPHHASKKLTLPPLDVLMVWHAYMLSPGWYSEDTNRIEALKGLRDAGIAFGAALGRGLQNLVASEPFKGRTDLWTKMTGTPFNPFESAKWTKDFSIGCTKCAFRITRETLAVRKLVNNLATVSMTNDSGLLAGTLYTETRPMDHERAQNIKKTMMSTDSLKRPTTWISDETYTDFVLEEANCKPETLKRRLSRNMHNQGGRLLVDRIMSVYVDDKMFSVELVGVVSVPWYLSRVPIDFTSFLDLTWEFPKSFFIPTLDIDLVWHTHQLMTTVYAHDTSTHMDRYIDHNDKVEESRLTNSFDDTCQKWKSKYGLNYMDCNPPAGSSKARAHHVPPKRDNILATTGPSVHNTLRGRKLQFCRLIRERERAQLLPLGVVPVIVWEVDAGVEAEAEVEADRRVDAEAVQVVVVVAVVGVAVEVAGVGVEEVAGAVNET
ncbi:hypothetical protein C8F04DRAFT_1174732 [Mycena alexandri]|uniref:Uncharacterized protein n=1 Tax=Mycena alexandri TaxID=1745969 RepID=A0AAD6TFP0_9AGAR|nr:hypothetical protein C8F04DRAFT_1174732 [Mycena alexandri]